MLNEASNNNEITCKANVVLNEVPNSNDGTVCVVNSVCLTTMGARGILIIGLAIILAVNMLYIGNWYSLHREVI